MRVISIQEKPDSNHYDLKPCTLTDLARLYETTPKTMKKWLQPFTIVIGIKRGRYYTVKQVEIIFEKLCPPTGIEFIKGSNHLKIVA